MMHAFSSTFMQLMKEFVAQGKNFTFLKELMYNLSKVKGETNCIDFFHLSSTFTE